MIVKEHEMPFHLLIPNRIVKKQFMNIVLISATNVIEERDTQGQSKMAT